MGAGIVYPYPVTERSRSSPARYDIDSRTKTVIDIYSLRGRKVATLVNGFTDAGTWSVPVGGVRSPELNAGMYIVRMKAGNVKLARKMTLVK